MKKLMLLILLSMILVACGPQEVVIKDTPTPEIDTLEIYLAEVDDLLAEWDDALEIAGSTPRMSLAGPVGELQAIRRRAKNIYVEEEFDPAHRELLSMMNHTIDAFLAFMADEEDHVVTNHFNYANMAQEAFIRKLANLQSEE